MGDTQSSPWRETGPFGEEAIKLRKSLKAMRSTDLRITLVGNSGAGKSSLINSIFSVSRGRIADMTSTKSSTSSGVGTHSFTGAESGKEDLFQRITFFDTKGFSEIDGRGISQKDLEACFSGKLNIGHKFDDEDDIPQECTMHTNPTCILIVVSAEELDAVDPAHRNHNKLREVNKLIPQDMAKIAVITKVDMVCPDSKRNFELIYKSKKVLTLVKKAKEILGIEENHVFPIINFIDEMDVIEERCVPIMFLLKFAFNFANDRKGNDKE